MSGVPFTIFPTSAISRFESSVFRVLFASTLWLPPPPHASVGAPIFLTFVAITGLHALWLECWGGVESQQLQEFAQDQGRACPRQDGRKLEVVAISD